MHAKSLQLCPTLCDPVDCSQPGSSVHGILQARILEWGACPPPGDLPDSGIEPASLLSPALAGEFFTTSFTWEAPSIPLAVLHLAPGFTHSLLFMCTYLSLEKNFKVLPPDSVS